MKTVYFLSFLFLMSGFALAQTTVKKSYDEIKGIVQPDIIQLSDSVIVYPLVGLTNIVNKMGRVPYTEIELWIVDAQGKIIYNNIIATKNSGDTLLDTEYCRYMKLQSHYLLQQRHLAINSR